MPSVDFQLAQWLPHRPKNAHKGRFGRVLVVAGSRTMCGAGFLCAKAALTAGAGLVYWALPQTMQPAFAAALPEVITLPLPEQENGAIAGSAWELFPEIREKYNPSLLVMGPGMDASPLLPRLLQSLALPLVIDADGLNMLSREPGWHRAWPKERPAVFTPHAGEMARLLGTSVAADEAARQAQVKQLAELTQGVALFKGAPTYVCAQLGAEPSLYQNTTGGPALAKAGSGDVLSGVIAGLWAQLGMEEGFSVHTAWKAAVCGVFLHGHAGDLAARKKGNYSVLATDTLAYLAQAFLAGEEAA